jgi:probable rRNA maturation factor
MILLDPGLLSGSAQGPASARYSAVAHARRDSADRLPSARTLARFLAAAQRAVRLRGQVSVLLTTDAEIRCLNRTFRGIDKTTDVLSFAAADTPAGEERIAGDLAIGFPTACRQAGEHGHSALNEIKILILHGLLHLAGYDHHADSGEMERRERLLRERLKLPQGLIERAGGDSARSRINRNKLVKAAASSARKGRKL